MKRLRRVLRALVVMVLVVFIAICGLHVYNWYSDYRTQKKETEKFKEVIKDKVEETEIFNRAALEELQRINSNIVGFITLEDGGISQPIVQPTEAEGDTYYMRRDIYRNYNILGCIFTKTSANVLRNGDYNIPIYGHNVTYSSDDMFSPLNRLKSQDFYDKYSHITVWWPDDKVEYLVTNVYLIPVSNLETYDFGVREWTDEKDFDEWIMEANIRNLITASEKCHYGDRLITLETCHQDGSEKRLIVVAKEVNRTAY